MHIETEAKFSGKVLIPININELKNISPGQTVKIIIEDKTIKPQSNKEVKEKIDFLKTFATDSNITTPDNLISSDDAFE